MQHPTCWHDSCLEFQQPACGLQRCPAPTHPSECVCEPNPTSASATLPPAGPGSVLQLSCTCGYAVRLTVGLVRRPLGAGPEFPSRITVTCSTGQVVRERVTSLEPVLNVTSPVVRGGGCSWARVAAAEAAKGGA